MEEDSVGRSRRRGPKLIIMIAFFLTMPMRYEERTRRCSRTETGKWET